MDEVGAASCRSTTTRPSTSPACSACRSSRRTRPPTTSWSTTSTSTSPSATAAHRGRAEGAAGDPRVPHRRAEGRGPVHRQEQPGARAGKILVDMTGGTEGPKKVIEKLADAGVGTIIRMHMSQELRDEADKHNIHVVIAGHMSSDSVGINLFLDELERDGVKTIATSGLIRVHRDEGARSARSRERCRRCELPPASEVRPRSRVLGVDACPDAPRMTPPQSSCSRRPEGRARCARPSRPAPTPSTSAWSAGARARSPATSRARPSPRRSRRPTFMTRARTWRSTRCSRTTRWSRRSRRWKRRTSPAWTRSSSPTSGFAARVREAYPDLPLHASTQPARTARRSWPRSPRLGFSRAILARELSLDEIAALERHGLELEAFVHGALCYGYSGDCLLSQPGRRPQRQPRPLQPVVPSAVRSARPAASTAGGWRARRRATGCGLEPRHVHRRPGGDGRAPAAGRRRRLAHSRSRGG